MRFLDMALTLVRWRGRPSMYKSLHSRQYTEFLEQLRTLRMRKGLRQSELATRLGRSQSMVSRVESGERRLDVVELWVWLIALETDLVAFASELNSRLASGGFDVSRTRRPRIVGGHGHE